MKKLLLLVLFFTTTIIYATIPTGNSFQSFCDQEAPTVGDIVVSGSNIIWFNIDDSSGTQLPLSTLLENGEVYYAFDSTDTASGSLAVTVQLPIPAPNGYSIIDLCDVETLTLGDLPVFNTSGYDEIYWYSTETQESGTELPISTYLIDGATYYAFQAVCNCGNNDCLGVLSVTINLIEVAPAPTGDLEPSFCNNEIYTLNDVAVFNTDGYDTIYWYDNTFCQEGNILSSTTPLVDGTTYYAYQTSYNDCCPEYLPVTIHFENPIPAPTGEETQGFCMNDTPTISDLDVQNTDGFGDLYWYEDETQTTLVDPSTVLLDGVTYYCYQGIGSCVDFLGVTVSYMTCLSVNEENLIQFNIKPNPANDFINIDFNDVKQDITISIFTIYGSKLLENEYSNKKEINLYISKLEKGIYFVSVNIKGKTSIKKFIKE